MRIRDRISSGLNRLGKIKPSNKLTEQAVDAVFSYERDGHRWTFEEGHILIDGYDVAPVINQEEPTIRTLVGMASGLDEYKRHNERLAHRRPGVGKLVAMADALIERVMGRVKKIYDDKIFGVKWKLKGGDLIVNGVNIHAFLALYQVRKTEKAYQYLVGLQGKIDKLIANPSGSWRNEKVRASLLQLRREIANELRHRPPADHPGPLLHAGNHHR